MRHGTRAARKTAPRRAVRLEMAERKETSRSVGQGQLASRVRRLLSWTSRGQPDVSLCLVRVVVQLAGVIN